ncbi:PIG-X-domain-containing protein [Trichodelitschia bisporula]|uniref:Protein PBN1 n=1 Tax=Trichodelitschia bisporula TaxID=703511 RepID=A0A6G1I8H7_9PEZI|nr:PIG-X-domain-containing protein [Trichodelitschia bisporula]
MRERITYLIHPGSDFDPSDIEITSTTLAVSGLNADKEHQITIGFEQLPKEIWQVLKDLHELHIRWASPRPYSTVAPFVSRVSPGLHISLTPRNDSTSNSDLPALCPLLKTLFSRTLKCTSLNTFTTPPILSGRFSSSASKTFYAPVFTLADLSAYIVRAICPEENFHCRLLAHDLRTAVSLDADYSAISHALVLRALYPAPPSAPAEPAWYETHHASSPGALEVGILRNEPATEPAALSFGGYLAVVGKDTKAVQTLFSAPSRHHPLPTTSKFTPSLPPPQGLHPSLRLSFPLSALTPPDRSCRLHTALTLPSALFVDPYPFADALYAGTHGVAALHSLAGATDLEAPDWVVEQWGQAALFELAPPDPEDLTGSEKGVWNATLPLHARYLPPRPPGANSTGPSAAVPLPAPAVFWACPAEEGTKFAAGPFDRTDLGYDGLFGTRTMFYHFTPASVEGRAGLVGVVRVPVLDTAMGGLVAWGTAAVVMLGAGWVFWTLLGGLGVKRVGRAKVE